MKNCRYCEQGNKPDFIDCDGTRCAVSGQNGVLAHAFDDGFVPCENSNGLECYKKDDKPKLSLWRQGSCEENIDREFVETFVDDAVECLAAYRGCELNIEVYNPPFMDTPHIKGVSYNPGHLTVTFTKTNSTVPDQADIDFLFLFFEKGKFLRRGLSESDKKNLRENQMGAVEVITYNFDECWQILCLLGEQLDFSQISISCGAA